MAQFVRPADLVKKTNVSAGQIVRESGRGLGAVEGSGEERNWSKFKQFPVILMFPVWAGREERLNSNTIDGILLPGY